ncbi:PREDICTED: HMG-Y-related protein A-like [Tarenaya hassleriana]|uniref:HMG-Y-related protein A-like n=1 Tax=Tarenaya hassleriana TaxID=28532 RepID=UPI00053C8215|nr:PREDICTED: HMG-Y-related protein A-like [Tarenaya hassleriana]
MATENSFVPECAPSSEQNSSQALDLPPYPQMIMEAIEALNDKIGSNKTAISKHIESLHPTLPPSHATLLSYHLSQLKHNGQLVMVKNNYMKPDPGAPPKRGRGRPPKPKLPVDSNDVTAAAPPRSRGRPPKSKEPLEQSNPPNTKPYAGTGRPRGRPSKKARSDSGTNAASAAAHVAPVAQPNGERRGRGRPPKVKQIVAPVGC